MRHTLLLLLLVLSSASLRADRMMDIMRNYNAKTMSVAEMDSVLEAYPQPICSMNVHSGHSIEPKALHPIGKGVQRGERREGNRV